MMFTLIRNEMIKLMSRKKTVIITIAFAILVAFIGFAMYKTSESMKEWNKPERRIQNEQENIKHLEEFKKDPKISEADKKRFDEDIKQSYERIEEIKKEKQGVKPDWRVTLKKEISGMEAQLKDTQIREQDKESIKLELMTKKYLLENNIQPEYNSYDVTATAFIRQLFEILGTIFLAVGVIIFSSDMVSGEYTPPTMKFLLTQPVSRGKVLFSKFIALILSSSIIIVVIEILAFLIMGLIFSFGNMDYPVTTGTRFMYDLTVKGEMGQKAITAIAGSSYIIPMWKYIVQMFGIQILFIIASASFAFLLSTVVKSSMVSMASTTVIIIAFTIAQTIPYINKYAHYLFTTFGDPSKILTGNIALRSNNPVITPTFSIAILLGWTIVSYVISHVVFKKRDILI